MKNNLVLFLMTLLVSAMISCSSDNDQGTNEVKQLDEIRAEMYKQMQNSPNHPDRNQTATTRAKIDDGGGSSLCYNAYMKYDYDCDGSFEVGVNNLTATWSCCWQEVSNLAWKASQNGWCYDFEPELQCQLVSCDPVPLCFIEWNEPF